MEGSFTSLLSMGVAVLATKCSYATVKASTMLYQREPSSHLGRYFPSFLNDKDGSSRSGMLLPSHGSFLKSGRQLSVSIFLCL